MGDPFWRFRSLGSRFLLTNFKTIVLSALEEFFTHLWICFSSRYEFSYYYLKWGFSDYIQDNKIMTTIASNWKSITLRFYILLS